MDSQVSDSVGVRVDRRKTWTDALFATLRPSDHFVSDDEIFDILNAVSDEEAAAELLAAKGVSVPMYCVWKTKYRRLNLEELRKLRRRELWRARCLVGMLLVAAVLAAGAFVVGLARAASANIAESAARRHDGGGSRPHTAVAPVPAEGRVGPVTEPSGAGVSPPPEAALVQHGARSDALPPTTEPGYKIQVAAASSLQEGRVLLERLASAGYPAYLARAIVSNVEVFRVRVGPFDTILAAEEVVSQLKRDGFTGAWVAR